MKFTISTVIFGAMKEPPSPDCVAPSPPRPAYICSALSDFAFTVNPVTLPASPPVPPSPPSPVMMSVLPITSPRFSATLSTEPPLPPGPEFECAAFPAWMNNPSSVPFTEFTFTFEIEPLSPAAPDTAGPPAPE